MVEFLGLRFLIIFVVVVVVLLMSKNHSIHSTRRTFMHLVWPYVSCLLHKVAPPGLSEEK